MNRLGWLSKLLLVLIGLVGVYFGINAGIERGWIPKPAAQRSTLPPKMDLPDVAAPTPVAPPAVVTPITATTPSATPSRGAPTIRIEHWAWNGQSGLILANGGARTAPGSLMAARGVTVQLIRQDDTSKMQADLMTFAEAYASGDKNPQVGTSAVIIMGDGAASFLAAVNPRLAQVCPTCIAKIYGIIGYSRGEDGFWAPPAVKADAKKAKGLVVAGVCRDGDWNIVLKWARENEIPNNPDDRTYDPQAINWVCSDDYMKAAEDRK